MNQPLQGEVWWGESPDAKGRPYLVVTRNQAIAVLATVVVAPITRTIRGIPTEVRLGEPEGLPVESVAAMDSLTTFPKSMLVRRMGGLGTHRRHELCSALGASADC